MKIFLFTTFLAAILTLNGVAFAISTSYGPDSPQPSSQQNNWFGKFISRITKNIGDFFKPRVPVMSSDIGKSPDKTYGKWPVVSTVKKPTVSTRSMNRIDSTPEPGARRPTLASWFGW